MFIKKKEYEKIIKERDTYYKQNQDHWGERNYLKGKLNMEKDYLDKLKGEIDVVMSDYHILNKN